MMPVTGTSRILATSSHAEFEQSPKPLRAVVIGGSGQIGGWLLRTLSQRGHSVTGTYATVQFPGLFKIETGDLQVAADWIKQQAPDVVFYPAGFTWVDG